MSLADEFFKFFGGSGQGASGQGSGLLENIFGGNSGVTLQNQLGRAVTQAGQPAAAADPFGAPPPQLQGRPVEQPAGPFDANSLFGQSDPNARMLPVGAQDQMLDPSAFQPPPPQAPPPTGQAQQQQQSQQQQQPQNKDYQFAQPPRGVMEQFIQQLPELALGAFSNVAKSKIPYHSTGGFIGLGALRGLQGAAVPLAHGLAANREQAQKDESAMRAGDAYGRSLGYSPEELAGFRASAQLSNHANVGELDKLQQMRRDRQIDSATESIADAVEKQLLAGATGRDATQIKAVVQAARVKALKTGDTTALIALSEKAFDPDAMAQLAGNRNLSTEEVGTLIGKITKNPDVVIKILEMRHKLLVDPMDMSETKLRAAIAMKYAKDPVTGEIDLAKAEEKMLQMEAGRHGVDTQQYAAALAQAKREGVGDIRSRADEIYDQALKGKSKARSTGTQEGALGVRQTPGYQQTETNIAAAREAGKPLPPQVQTQVAAIDDILSKGKAAQSLYKPEYVGGVMGAFGGKGSSTGGVRGAVREATGNLTPDEVTFRQNTADIQDMLLRARSGAQINEQEYNRLTKIAPSLTDQPASYPGKLSNFLSELEKLKQNKISLASTPRASLGATPPPPAAPGTPKPASNNRQPPKAPPQSTDPEVQRYLESLGRR